MTQLMTAGPVTHTKLTNKSKMKSDSAKTPRSNWKSTAIPPFSNTKNSSARKSSNCWLLVNDYFGFPLLNTTSLTF